MQVQLIIIEAKVTPCQGVSGLFGGGFLKNFLAALGVEELVG